jgi:hypothetical protein
MDSPGQSVCGPPVFGVGEAEGIHYYAMQFIQGQGLDSVLEEVRRLRGRMSGARSEDNKPGRDLSASIAQGLLTGQFQELPASAGHAFAAPAVVSIPSKPLEGARVSAPGRRQARLTGSRNWLA